VDDIVTVFFGLQQYLSFFFFFAFNNEIYNRLERQGSLNLILQMLTIKKLLN